MAEPTFWDSYGTLIIVGGVAVGAFLFLKPLSKIGGSISDTVGDVTDVAGEGLGLVGDVVSGVRQGVSAVGHLFGDVWDAITFWE